MFKVITTSIMTVVAVFVLSAMTGYPRYDQGLSSVVVDEIPWGIIEFHYNENLVDLIMEEIPTGPFKVVKIGKCAFSEGEPKDYYIYYMAGPSRDPNFQVFRESTGGELERISGVNNYGLRATLPGDGALYVRGHANEYFDKRKKYSMHDGQFVEIEQPFYYVGLDSKALTDLSLFSDSGPVDIIRAGEPVTVILNVGNRYLLKNQQDIVGWWILKNLGQRATEIEGLYLRGD
jgi:hypothetical protein